MIPLVAINEVVDAPTAPLAYEQVKVVLVRNGSIRISSEDNELLIHAGDVIILPAETTFHAVPEPHATVTCIFISPEYALDLIYWQYRGHLESRDEARALAKRLYSGVRMIIPLGKQIQRLAPILDNMVILSDENDFASYSNQMQAHWFTIAHAITRGIRRPQTLPSPALGSAYRRARPAPVRPEVLLVDELMRNRPAHNWTLRELAARAHLSPGHLSSLCARVWGYPPRTRLQLVRTDALAALLRESNLPVKQCIFRVGWRNHSHAASIFRSVTGLSPGEYRAACLRDASEILGHEIKDHGNPAEGMSL